MASKYSINFPSVQPAAIFPLSSSLGITAPVHAGNTTSRTKVKLKSYGTLIQHCYLTMLLVTVRIIPLFAP